MLCQLRLSGTNMTWDYSTVYTPSDIFQIDTKAPTVFSTRPSSASKATNAAFIRSTKKAGYSGFYYNFL